MPLLTVYQLLCGLLLEVDLHSQSETYVLTSVNTFSDVIGNLNDVFFSGQTMRTEILAVLLQIKATFSNKQFTDVVLEIENLAEKLGTNIVEAGLHDTLVTACHRLRQRYESHLTHFDLIRKWAGNIDAAIDAIDDPTILDAAVKISMKQSIGAINDITGNRMLDQLVTEIGLLYTNAATITDTELRRKSVNTIEMMQQIAQTIYQTE